MAEQSRPGDRDQDEGAVQVLDIRVRSVLAEQGRGEAQASVYCPRRERSVPLDACATCDAGAGVRVDRSGATTAMLCRFIPDAEGEAARPPTPRRDDELAAKLLVPVSELMARSVVCVRSTLSIEEAKAVLIERGFGGLPVVDPAGRPIGVLSKSDLLRTPSPYGWRADEGAGAQPRAPGPDPDGDPQAAPGTVGAVMTTLVLAVHERSSIAQAAALMAYEGVHRLPVLDDDRQVVGLLSSLDILHWLGERSGYLMRPTAPHKP